MKIQPVKTELKRCEKYPDPKPTTKPIVMIHKGFPNRKHNGFNKVV